jgi:hypothetical protein
MTIGWRMVLVLCAGIRISDDEHLELKLAMDELNLALA